MSMSRRMLLALTILVLVVWLTLAWMAYPQLPSRIPTHFGPGGRVDHEVPRSLFQWFLLPLVGGGTTVFLQVVAEMAPRWPNLLNVPAKAELLALPPAMQRPLFEQVRTFMAAIGLMMLLLFCGIHYDTWRIAVTGARALSVLTQGMMVALLVATLGATVWWTRYFTASVERATRAAADATRTSPPRRAS